MRELGDKAAAPVRGALFRLLRNALAAHGGREVDNTGDGVMAVFDGARDALACAIAMQQGAADLGGAPDDTGVMLRIGLHTGEPLLNDDGRYFGMDVVIAARLCAAARSREVLTSDVVRAVLRAAGGFEFDERGPLRLKGVGEPVETFSVRWTPAERRPAGLPPFLASAVDFPFVGRAEEREALNRAWRAARAGHLQVTLLLGEPGIGKTRLAAEVARGAADEGAIVLAGRCDDALGVPFQPFAECLEQFLASVDDLGLRDVMGARAGELTRLAPSLATRMPEVAPGTAEDPEIEQYRLFEAVAEWLEALSRSRPVMVVLDDLHWAARPTVLMLRHVVRAQRPGRVLVIGTYRDTDLDAAHPLHELLGDTARLPGFSRLALAGLDQGEVLELLAGAAGHGLDADERAASVDVRDATDGNPLFVVELVRHFAETGVVTRRGDRWTIAEGAVTVNVPDSVRDVVTDRVARLGQETRVALAAAAVVGREFDLALVVGASALEEDVVLTSLEAAADAHLVREFAADRWGFAHEIVRATLSDSLSESRRARLHRRIAEVLDARRGTRAEAPPSDRARHWLAAGPGAVAEGVASARAAGDLAVARLAFGEAVSWYGAASQALEGSSEPLSTEACDLLLLLGEARWHAGDAAYRAALQRASVIARELGDTDRLVRAVLIGGRGTVSVATGVVDEDLVGGLEAALVALDGEESARRADVLATLGVELVFSGNWQQRVRLSDESLTLARRIGDPTTLSRVLTLRRSTISHPSTVDERLAIGVELAELARLHNNPSLEDTSIAAALEAGNVELADEQIALEEQLLTIDEKPSYRWQVAFWRATRVIMSGALDEGERAALDALELGNASGQTDAFLFFAPQLFQVRYHQGRLEELRSTVEDLVAETPEMLSFRAALALLYTATGQEELAGHMLNVLGEDGFSRIPWDLTWSATLAFCSEVAARLHRREDAEALYAQLAPYADRFVAGVVWFYGSVHRYLGLLAGSLDRPVAADEHYAAAVDAHGAMRSPAWLATCQIEWARQRRTRGDNGDDTVAMLRTGRESAHALGLEIQ